MNVLISVTSAMSLLMCCSSHADLKKTGIPRFDDAVAKAVGFLQTNIQPAERESSLVAYALLKAGVTVADPVVSAGIAAALERAEANTYGQYEESYLAAVDAMLLADANGKKYRKEIQNIADKILSYQRSNGSWHDPGLGSDGPADVSLSQYCILGLWAARRAGCRVPPSAFDDAAEFLMSHVNEDGGWTYRITGPTGKGTGASIYTMTMAGVGSLAICRLMLEPPSKQRETQESSSPFNLDILRPADEVDEEEESDASSVEYARYKARSSSKRLEETIRGGVAWNTARFRPIPNYGHVIYYYYTLERAGAFTELQEDWYTAYGNGLLTLQHSDGHFDGHQAAYGSAVTTSFALLYLVRSTKAIIEDTYGKGIQIGGRDLEAMFYGKQTKAELGPLDDLLAAMEGQNFADLDVSTDDLVDKIQFASKEELVGQVDVLKSLVKSKDPANRQIAYWALSRTADFSLVSIVLNGLDDPNLSVNVEAILGLRYLARRPNGFNLSLTPVEDLPADADDQAKSKAVQVWRRKISRVWRTWYAGVRPYSESGGQDELSIPND